MHPVLTIMQQARQLHLGKSMTYSMRDMAKYLHDPCTSCSCESQCAHAQLGDLVHTHIVCDGAHYNCDLLIL